MDPHEREGDAAVAGMIETYGPRFSPPRPVIREGRVVDTWADGDYVPFFTKDGTYRQGYIIAVVDEDGDGMYRIKSHRIGGGVDFFDVRGSEVHVF